MADMDRQPQFVIDEDQWDEGCGCWYRVKVVGSTEVEEEEAVDGRSGLHIKFLYRLIEDKGGVTLSFYDLKFRGQICRRSHDEARLTSLIDLGGIPSAARDEITRLIFSLYGLGDAEPIQALAQVYAYEYVPPNHETVYVDLFLSLLDKEEEDQDPEEALLDKVSVSVETQCAVCFDEFPIGSNATRMPCSHDFHAPCILRWLQNSYLCPVCRFELPALHPLRARDRDLPS